MAGFRVLLPWPSRVLHPNARVHWARKAKAAKEAREAAQWACKGWAGGDVSSVAITFRAPDRRRRDLDGMLAAIKSALDGISDATGTDDSKWSITMQRGDPYEGGLVIVDLA